MLGQRDAPADGVKVAVDPASIANGIKRVVGDPSRSRSLGAEGQRTIEDRFHRDAIDGRVSGIHRAIDV